MDLILASASPRRSALLKQIGLSFSVIPSQLPEPPFTEGHAADHARSLAHQKALDIATSHRNALVIGADTIVVVDDQVLGKPEDPEQALQMLKRLSNRWHQVITAYSLIQVALGVDTTQHVTTDVHFRELSDGDMRRYIETGAPFDKAGAYGIQDQSAIFVSEIRGCFYNVVGFPVSQFYSQLTQLVEQYHLVL